MAQSEKGAGDADMNKTNLITVSLVIIGAILIGASIAYWQQGEAKGWETELYDKFGQKIDIDYLILQMEWAKETHQDIVDNPWRHWAWQKAGIDHSEWVEIYDQVIEVLENKR